MCNEQCFLITAGRSDFLKYATGTGVVPPIGLRKVKIIISASEDAVHAATCINTISIPNFDDLDYDAFKTIMNSVIIIISEDFTSMKLLHR